MADPHTTMKAVVVDADQNSLLSLQKVLEECNYTVTTCEDSEQFLSMIREEQTNFQLVIIEVSVTPTNGYELCRLLRKNTNIPIIMTSSTDSKTETAEMVKKALHNGASDFLLKPIKLEDLGKINSDMTHQNLIKPLIKQEWNHGDQEQDISATNTTTTYSVQGGSLGKHKEESAVTSLEQPARKKRRVVWTQELHDVFVKAVNQLGTEKANPKKIMEVMNIDGLTRENVASHLQKYRQHLMKQQGGAQEKKPRRRQQLQQCEQNIVKPEQDVNQTLMSMPSSSISHQTETEDPIINSEQQVQATDVGSHQLVQNWPHTSVQEVGLLQESSSYDKLYAAWLPAFHLGQQIQQLQQQPSLYEQNLNPKLLMYDTNTYPARLLYDSNPSSAQFGYAQNSNPAQYMDEVAYVDSSNMGLVTDFPIEIPQHDPGLSGYPSVFISGLPITPRIEIKSGNLKACPADHSSNNHCPLYYDQHQLNGFYYDIEHDLQPNQVVNGGDGQGGELANQNDQINPQDIIADADADAFDLKGLLHDMQC